MGEGSGSNPSREKAPFSISPSQPLRRKKMEDQSVYRETKGKALIVDDAPDTREIIRKLLIYEGYEALKEGASDFVKKPFENEHLVHVVNQTLEKYLTLKEKEKLEEEVRRLSITDDLTGLYNHRYFFKTLESELVRRKRQKTSLSLIMLD